MSDEIPLESEDFVVVRTSEDSVDGAVEKLSDGGKNYFLVPKARLNVKHSDQSIPALTDPSSGELLIPTGNVIIRWQDKSDELKQGLKANDAQVVRDYGAGGVVSPKSSINPLAFARSLSKIKDVTKTQVQVLRPSQKR